MKSKIAARSFLLLGAPGLFWLGISLTLIFGYAELDIFGKATEWGTPIVEWIINTIKEIFSSIGEMYVESVSHGFVAGAILIPLVTALTLGIFAMMIVGFDLAFILLTLACVVGLIFIPLCIFDGYLEPHNWFFWLSCLMLIWTVICSFLFELGEFLEDTSYISGVRITQKETFNGYEITSSPIYDGGEEIWFNILLIVVRFFVIAIIGFPLFIAEMVKLSKI